MDDLDQDRIKPAGFSRDPTLQSYLPHPKSRIPRNSMEINNMTFSTRNTLPCFASRSMRVSLSPCLPASSPSSL